MNFFIITNFQTDIRGEQGHPTGNMTSCLVPFTDGFPKCAGLVGTREGGWLGEGEE